jgi:hypothetical protein
MLLEYHEQAVRALEDAFQSSDVLIFIDNLAPPRLPGATLVSFKIPAHSPPLVLPHGTILMRRSVSSTDHDFPT